MINLEQVRLLETRVAKAVDFIERVTKENAAMGQQVMGLQNKLTATQERIDELESLVTGFKEDQGQIEESILAALDKLSQFEKAMEKSLKDKPKAKAPRSAPEETVPEEETSATETDSSGDGQTCFEIPEDASDDDDIPDPLGDTANETAATEGGELDIF